MIGYVTIGTDDLDAARSWYDALLGEVGASRLMQMGEEDGGFTLYGTGWGSPAIAVTRPFDGAPQQPGNGNMIGLVVDARAKVDALHAKAMALGGTDEGAGIEDYTIYVSEDGGPFVTFPLVITNDPETGERNMGMYRMQVMSKNTTGMHWQRHKTGTRHLEKAKKMGKRLEVAVAIGGDPHSFTRPPRRFPRCRASTSSRWPATCVGSDIPS